MTSEQSIPRDLRIQDAIKELKTLIRRLYPEAQFEIMSDADGATAIHLTTTVDTEDPEDVIDVVIDWLLEIQVEERLPIHVIPLLPVERFLVQEAAALVKH